MLWPTQLLDVRPSDIFAARPTAKSDNIPLSEMEKSIFRLPPKGVAVHIYATGDEANEAGGILSRHSRPNELTRPEYAPNRVGAYRLWTVPKFLDQELNGMIPGKALCLACGTGREAVFLASLGWDVTAIDILPDALDQGRELERIYVPSGSPAINWLEVDLTHPLPEYLGPYSLVTQFRYWNVMTKQHLQHALPQGGVALLEVFAECYWAKRGKSVVCWPNGEWDGWCPNERIEGDMKTLRLHIPG